MTQHAIQPVKKLTDREKHALYLREQTIQKYQADSRRMREIPLVIEKIVKTQRDAASKFSKVASKDSKNAEKVLRLVIKRMQDYEKTKGQKGKIIAVKANAALFEFWSQQVSFIERKFLELSEKEAREIRSKGAKDLYAVESILTKVADELYAKAHNEEEGSRMASALFRAFSTWQQEAASVGAHARIRPRK